MNDPIGTHIQDIVMTTTLCLSYCTVRIIKICMATLQTNYHVAIIRHNNLNNHFRSTRTHQVVSLIHCYSLVSHLVQHLLENKCSYQ